MDLLLRPSVIDVASVVSIWLSLVPFLVLVFLRPDAKAPHWIVAGAFLTALIVGDAVQRYDNALDLTEDAWLNTWVWPPVQFAILARAVIDSSLVWWAAVAGIAFALWLVMPDQITGPDAVVTIVGSIIVLAALHVKGGPLYWPLVVYCFVGSLMYVGYAFLAKTQAAGATYFWYAYQGSRLAAFALFGRAAWRAPK